MAEFFFVLMNILKMENSLC